MKPRTPLDVSLGAAIALAASMFLTGCGPSSANASEANLPATGPDTRTTEKHPEHGERHTMWVTATAYCSRPQETDGDPFIAAWNERLDPNVKSIAVSRDLLEEGLHHRSSVWIEIDGKETGPYLVLDKMNKRWKHRIDVYFGVDLKAALEFGKKRVRISWKTSASKPEG